MRNQDFQDIVFSAYNQETKQFDFDTIVSEKQQELSNKIEQLTNTQKENDQKITELTSFIQLLGKKDIDPSYQKALDDLNQDNQAVVSQINALSQEQEELSSGTLYSDVDTYMDIKANQAKALSNTLQERVVDQIKSIQEQASKIQELFKDKKTLADQVQKDVTEITEQETQKMKSTPKYKTIAEFNDVAQAYKAFRNTQKNIEEDKSLEGLSEYGLFLKNFKTSVLIAKEFYNGFQDAFVTSQELYKAINKNRNIEIPTSNKISFNQMLGLDVLERQKNHADSLNKARRYNRTLKGAQGINTILDKLFAIPALGSILVTSTGKMKISHHDILLSMGPDVEKVHEFENEKLSTMPEDGAFNMITQNAGIDYGRLQAFSYLGESIQSLQDTVDLPIIQDMLSFVSTSLDEIQVEKYTTKRDIYESLDSDKREELVEEYKTQIRQKNKTAIKKPSGYVFESLLTDIILSDMISAVIESKKEGFGNFTEQEAKFHTILCEIVIETNIECHDKDIGYCRKKYFGMTEMIRLLESHISSIYDEISRNKTNEDQELNEIDSDTIKRYRAFKHSIDMRHHHRNYRNGANAIAGYYNTLFQVGKKYEQYSIENRSQVAQLYFKNIDRTEVLYDDPICLYPDNFMLKDNTKNDFAIEVNKIEHKNTLAAIKIADFDTYMNDERMMNILKTALQTTNREQKLQEIKARYLIEDDECVTKYFQNYGIVRVHTDGSLSINGYHKDSLEFLLPEGGYEILQTYLYRYILECTQVIDKRDIKDPEQLLQGIHEDGDMKRKDPRSVYDLDHNESMSTRIVDHRDPHKRLLAKKMMPGAQGFTNAMFYEKELYAEVYPHNHDSRIDKPIQKIKINESEDYQVCIELCKELKELYNTDTTVIRFETCIKEFSRTPEAERKMKMNTVGAVGKSIQAELEKVT